MLLRAPVEIPVIKILTPKGFEVVPTYPLGTRTLQSDCSLLKMGHQVLLGE